ncbi:MAG: CDP-alcohol phosphatidyltransferase family protein [Acidobacteriota bacterium]
MLSRLIGKACKALLDLIVRGVSFLRIDPNLLTFIGFLITIFAGVFFAQGRFFAAGWVIILAGLFDMLDGRVARITDSVTKFGAFFDSVLDRYSDIFMFLGLMIYYAKSQRLTYMLLSGVVMMGAIMTSYSRARAESLIPACKVGFMERPERLVLLIIGALSNRMAPVLWVMAVFSNLTVIHRIIYTWRESSKTEPTRAVSSG